MVYKPKRFDVPRGLTDLSPEGQALVLEAREHLDTWIDENVDRLEAEMQATIEEKRRVLAAEVVGLQEEIAAGQQRMTDVLDRLGDLEESFEAGDGITVDQAVRATRDTVQAVRAALDERERRVRGLARAAVSAGISAATRL